MRTHRTGRHDRSIALRYRAGLALACVLVAIMGAGMAHAAGILESAEAPPLSTLVKFDDREYDIAYSEDVSLEPLHSTTVRKIGYGEVTTVNIATTATGTYSSDALTSPYVLYPGISVSEVIPEDVRRRMWTPGRGFAIFSVDRGYNGGLTFSSLTDHGVRTCMTRGSFTSCYRTY